MSTTNADHTAVRVDPEYNAEEWWGELRERYPRFADSLQHNGAAVIASPLWNELASIPGFSGGPGYAQSALIDCGGDGPMWADVVAGRHQTFERLY